MHKAADTFRTVAPRIVALGGVTAAFIFVATDIRLELGPSSFASLGSVESYVEKRFPVRNLSAAEFVERRRNRNVVVLDVREQKEFDVSHISGAVRISPTETAEGLVEKLADKLHGAEVVFYCSVGVRSSKLLQELQPALRKFGVNHAYNLRGGIFRWHIDQKPLFRGSFQTRAVHPFDEAWGKLLERDLKRQRGDS